MTSVTNLVPIRIDASSSDGAVRIIDTLLIDTTCLPISHAHPPHDGHSSGLNSLSSTGGDHVFSLSSLVDVNAAHLTESILADSEVYGAVRSSSKTFMGGRLDLLGDAQLFGKIEEQISKQLRIALSADKKALTNGTSLTPEVTSSGTSGGGGATEQKSNNIRINLRLRHENIVVVDEFDYDINSSNMEGCDPFSIANGLVEDLKLPKELGPSIAATIVEQIYGVDVSGSLDRFTSNAALRDMPSALVLEASSQGTSTDFAQYMLSNSK